MPGNAGSSVKLGQLPDGPGVMKGAQGTRRAGNGADQVNVVCRNWGHVTSPCYGGMISSLGGGFYTMVRLGGQTRPSQANRLPGILLSGFDEFHVSPFP
jgi:hypothetical protein